MVSAVEGRSKLTWAQREFLALARAHGGSGGEPSSDVARVPQEFWEAVILAADEYLIDLSRPPGSSQAVAGWRDAWKAWEHHFLWGTGMGPLKEQPWLEFQRLVRTGVTTASTVPEHWLDEGDDRSVKPSLRLAAIEHLLNLGGPQPHFAQALNVKAHDLRIALRLEGTRFVLTDSDEILESTIGPAMRLLDDRRYREAEALYRRANEQARAGHHNQAVGTALSALGVLLRELGWKGDTLAELMDWTHKLGLAPGIVGIIGKMGTLEQHGDSAMVGPAESMLAINLSGALIHYLAGKLS